MEGVPSLYTKKERNRIPSIPSPVQCRVSTPRIDPDCIGSGLHDGCLAEGPREWMSKTTSPTSTPELNHSLIRGVPTNTVSLSSILSTGNSQPYSPTPSLYCLTHSTNPNTEVLCLKLTLEYRHRQSP